MIPSLHQRFGFVLLATCLGLSVSALAQNTPSVSPPMNGAGSPTADRDPDVWANESFERQNYREEMEQIRKEHEEIENARDRLMDRCVNVGTTQAEQCKVERQALHERQEKLHERMKALHEKMETERKEREEHHEQAGKSRAPGNTPPTPPN